VGQGAAGAGSCATVLDVAGAAAGAGGESAAGGGGSTGGVVGGSTGGVLVSTGGVESAGVVGVVGGVVFGGVPAGGLGGVVPGCVPPDAGLRTGVVDVRRATGGVYFGDGARPPPRSAPAREDTFVVPLVDVVVAGTSLVDCGTTSTVPASGADVLDAGPCAAATWTPRSGAEPMTLTATTPATAVTRTPAAAPRTGSLRYAGRGSRWLPTYCM
jgi:hypothetical protein